MLSLLNCPLAKAGGAVNGGHSPFILPLTGSAAFAIFMEKSLKHRRSIKYIVIL